MNACEIWLRRDFLLTRGIEPDEPPCDHDPLDCPPNDRPAVSNTNLENGEADAHR